MILGEEDQTQNLAASDSVGKFLNMETPEENDVPDNLPVADLPVIDVPAETVSEKVPAKEVKTVGELFNKMPAEKTPGVEAAESEPLAQKHSVAEQLEQEHQRITSPMLRIMKNILPYVVIFIIAVVLYFFYFSSFSINSLFKSNNLTLQNVTSSNSNADLDKLKKDQNTAYLAWMKQFFFEVNDDSIISMDADVSGNGLTNFEKYLLNLNPKVYSTRGGTDADGQLVINDISPWTGKPFTDAQKELVNKYINKELISNRITAAALTRGVTKFAQYVNTDSPYYIDPKTLASTNPSEVENNQTAYQASQQAGNNQSNNQSVNINSNSGINLAIAGRLDIPDNKISVPLTWTKDVKDFDADLKKGIVHYPGTALPGEIGTSYISGHSSGYLWDKSPYKTIFAGLGNVKDGTSFTITATQNNGKQVVFHYTVNRRGEYEANDQAQFVNTADSVVALSTCWPVNTTARRLVLFAKLTQTEQL